MNKCSKYFQKGWKRYQYSPKTRTRRLLTDSYEDLISIAFFINCPIKFEIFLKQLYLFETTYKIVAFRLEYEKKFAYFEF